VLSLTGPNRLVFQNVYSPECVPPSFSLGDLDHLTGFKISSLYNHWLSRQQKKLQPFIVLNAGPLHHTLVAKTEKPKGKKTKLEYVPFSSDEGENEDESDDGRKDVPPLKFGPPTAGPSKPYNLKSRRGDIEGVNKAKVRDSFLLCQDRTLQCAEWFHSRNAYSVPNDSGSWGPMNP
jgi:hypothetical protein